MVTPGRAPDAARLESVRSHRDWLDFTIDPERLLRIVLMSGDDETTPDRLLRKLVRNRTAAAAGATPAWVDLKALREEARRRYVASVDVPCVTPAELLRRRGWPAGSVDVLAVDTEGTDADVVGAWLDAAPEFRPTLLVWEHVHVGRAAREALLARLAALGYDCKHTGECPPNVVCVADTVCLLRSHHLGGDAPTPRLGT